MNDEMTQVINELSKHTETLGYIYKPNDSVYFCNGYALIIEERTDNVIAAAYKPCACRLFDSVLTMLRMAEKDGHAYIKIIGWHRWKVFTKKLPNYKSIMIDPSNDTAYIKLERI